MDEIDEGQQRQKLREALARRRREVIESASVSSADDLAGLRRALLHGQAAISARHPIRREELRDVLREDARLVDTALRERWPQLFDESRTASMGYSVRPTGWLSRIVRRGR